MHILACKVAPHSSEGQAKQSEAPAMRPQLRMANLGAAIGSTTSSATQNRRAPAPDWHTHKRYRASRTIGRSTRTRTTFAMDFRSAKNLATAGDKR